MISDYEKIEFLIEHNYFEHHKVSDIIKDIKFQCIRYLVKDWNLDLEEISFNDYLQSWIDYKFQDNDFIDFLKEQCFDEKVFDEYQIVYKKICSFLNQKIAKPKDTAPSYFFIKTSKIRFEHTAYKLIKKSIVKLTKINYEALEVTSQEQFKILIKHKITIIPKKFRKFKLKNYLKIYDETDQVMGLNDFDHYLDLPSIINKDILENGELKKTLFIEGLSGSGKTTLAQRIGYEISFENCYYINLLEEFKKFNFEENKANIILFIKKLESVRGLLILDNIQFSNNSKFLTKQFLKESNKQKLNIIVVAQQNSIIKKTQSKTFFDNFLEQDKYKLLKEEINLIEISNKNELIVKSLISNFINYYFNKNIISQECSYDINLINIIKSKFGSQLIYLKYATEDTLDLNDLNLSSAKSYIRNKYSILLDLKECKDFKILITLFAAHNHNLKISKKIYRDEFVHEIDVIEYLKKKNLLYIQENKDDFELKFHHNEIPRLLIDILTKQEDKSSKELLTESLIRSSRKYKDLLDEIIYEYLYFFNLNEKVPLLIDIVDIILENSKKMDDININDYIDLFLLMRLINQEKSIDLVIKYYDKLLTKDMILDNWNVLGIFFENLEKSGKPILIVKTLDFIFENIKYIKLNLNIIKYLLINYQKLKIPTTRLDILVDSFLENEVNFLKFIKSNDFLILKELYIIKNDKLSNILNINISDFLESYLDKNYSSIEVYYFIKDISLLNDTYDYSNLLDNFKNTNINYEIKYILELKYSDIWSILTNQALHLNIMMKDFVQDILDILTKKENKQFLINFMQSSMDFIGVFEYAPLFDLIIKLGNKKYQDKICNILNNDILIPSSFNISAADTWKIMTHPSLSKFTHNIIDVILKENGDLLYVITNLNIKDRNYFIIVIDRLYNSNSKHFKTLFKYYFMLIDNILYKKDFRIENCIDTLLLIEKHIKYDFMKEEIIRLLNSLDEKDFNKMLKTLRECEYCSQLISHDSQDQLKKSYLSVYNSKDFSLYSKEFINKIMEDLDIM